MSADTNLMPIPGPVDPVPVPRAAITRADGKVELIGLPREQIRAALEEAGLEPQAGQAARQADLALDLQSRGRRFRGDDRHRQGPAAAGWPSASPLPGRKWSRRRCRPTAPANGCSAPTTAMISRWCSSPTPTAARLCVSSQVGCTLNCRFCHTGTMKLVRNLEPAEIVGQVMLARDALGEWPESHARQGRMLTNIVMMGMGEPLYNFDNVSTR